MIVNAQQHISNDRVAESIFLELTDFLREHQVEVRLFVDSFIDNQIITPRFLEGFRVQKIIDAVIQSHEIDHRITIDSMTNDIYFPQR